MPSRSGLGGSASSLISLAEARAVPTLALVRRTRVSALQDQRRPAGMPALQGFWLILGSTLVQMAAPVVFLRSLDAAVDLVRTLVFSMR